MVFDHDGELVASAPQFREALVICDLAVHPVFRKRLLDPRGHEAMSSLPLVTISDVPGPSAATVAGACPLPGRRAPPRAAWLRSTRRSCSGTADYVGEERLHRRLVGLSGGVDSSLVATIADDALGPERVHGVLMPSRYSSTGSLDDAFALAANLGIATTTVPIEAAHRVLLEMLEGASTGDPSAASPARTSRPGSAGVILMAISNERGWLVLTTGNKSEMAVGYATLYGDMAGGYRGFEGRPEDARVRAVRVPQPSAGSATSSRGAVIEKPPSAELRPDQRDDESLPPYDVLDPILEGYVERDLTVSDLVSAGFDAATVRKVIDLVDRAEYKRRQAPPGPRVTSRGFGKDRRMPITNQYRASAGTAGASAPGDPSRR